MTMQEAWRVWRIIHWSERKHVGEDVSFIKSVQYAEVNRKNSELKTNEESHDYMTDALHLLLAWEMKRKLNALIK